MVTGGWPINTAQFGPFTTKLMGPNSVEVKSSAPDGAEIVSFLRWFSPDFGQQLQVSYEDGSILMVYKIGTTYKIEGFVEKTVHSKNELDITLSRLSGDTRGDILFKVLDNQFNAINYILKDRDDGGQWPITTGTVQGTVTGLKLSQTPVGVNLSIQSQSLQYDGLFAWLTSSPTTDGFSFQLSAIPNFNYTLNYGISYGPIDSDHWYGGGQQSLPIGETTGTVQYLKWPKPPTSVILTVQAPNAGSDGIYAWVINSPGRDEFCYCLSSVPTANGYVLHYTADFGFKGKQLTLQEDIPLSPISWTNKKFNPSAILVTPSLPKNGNGLFTWVSTPYNSPGWYAQVSALPQ